MTGPSITTDAMLLEGVAQQHPDALRKIWDRYAAVVHWLSVLYERDAERAAEHVHDVFFELWSSPLAALRARSLPEHLTSAMRRRRAASESAQARPRRPTIGRLDRLTNTELTSVALLFAGDLSADEILDLLGCTRADLGPGDPRRACA